MSYLIENCRLCVSSLRFLGKFPNFRNEVGCSPHGFCLTQLLSFDYILPDVAQRRATMKWRNGMAMPIKPTPVLKKDEAVIFLKKVEANLDKPSHSIATPKLSQAKKLALQNADLRQK